MNSSKRLRTCVNTSGTELCRKSQLNKNPAHLLLCNTEQVTILATIVERLDSVVDQFATSLRCYTTYLTWNPAKVISLFAVLEP